MRTSVPESQFDRFDAEVGRMMTFVNESANTKATVTMTATVEVNEDGRTVATVKQKVSYVDKDGKEVSRFVNGQLTMSGDFDLADLKAQFGSGEGKEEA